MSHHREEFRVEGMAEPLSHYTDAVKAGGLLFVSGIVPLDADGNLVGEGDVAEQARQVFRNMQLCLSAAGCGFDDVVKVVHYLLDVDDRPKINPVRMEFFGEARPASTLVEVSALAVPGRCWRSKRSPLSRAELRLQKRPLCPCWAELEGALVG